MLIILLIFLFPEFHVLFCYSSPERVVVIESHYNKLEKISFEIELLLAIVKSLFSTKFNTKFKETNRVPLSLFWGIIHSNQNRVASHTSLDASICLDRWRFAQIITFFLCGQWISVCVAIVMVTNLNCCICTVYLDLVHWIIGQCLLAQRMPVLRREVCVEFRIAHFNRKHRQREQMPNQINVFPSAYVNQIWWHFEMLYLSRKYRSIRSPNRKPNG